MPRDEENLDRRILNEFEYCFEVDDLDIVHEPENNTETLDNMYYDLIHDVFFEIKKYCREACIPICENLTVGNLIEFTDYL